LLPRPDGSWRAGSTYEFDFSKPLSASVEEVSRKLAGLLKVPFQITGAQEGIRPIIKRIPGVVGRHPAHDRVLVLNGLGSKGVLRAPDFARRLVEQLLDGKPMDAEVDVRSLD
jgi:glycine/D-amino acid oxidase-like deaminating enzyme